MQQENYFVSQCICLFRTSLLIFFMLIFYNVDTLCGREQQNIPRTYLFVWACNWISLHISLQLDPFHTDRTLNLYVIISQGFLANGVCVEAGVSTVLHSNLFTTVQCYVLEMDSCRLYNSQVVFV